MAYETRDNTGSLFRNDRATTDRHPTHKGKALIGGIEYWVSGWVKESGPNSKAPGTRFFSLAFEPCERQDTQFGDEGRSAPAGGRGAGQGGQGQGQGGQGAQGQTNGQGGGISDDDDIPF